MLIWMKALLVVIVLGSLNACARNKELPPETAQMTLLRILAASSENSCTHILRISNVKTKYMVEGTIVFLSFFEATRIYRRHQKHCFNMINEEMKKMGLRYRKARG